jgi:hypothetical protein
VNRRKVHKIKKYWARKFFIRFHMSLILLGTVLIGLLASYLLWEAGLQKMTIRYPISVVISYGGFFVFIRLWLAYIRERDSRTKRILESAGDVPTPDFSQGSLCHETVFETGGGEFGGGGASGSFDIPGDEFVNGCSEVLTESSGSVAGDLVGETVSGIFDEGAGVIIIPLMIVLALVFGAAFFLIYEAPIILTEAAFEFLLAGVLIRQVKVMDDPNWVGSIFKSTWVPFSFTIAIAIGVGFMLTRIFPEATKITDIV